MSTNKNIDSSANSSKHRVTGIDSSASGVVDDRVTGIDSSASFESERAESPENPEGNNNGVITFSALFGNNDGLTTSNNFIVDDSSNSFNTSSLNLDISSFDDIGNLLQASNSSEINDVQGGIFETSSITLVGVPSNDFGLVM
ncbi:MAG: hypothetical protein QX190_13615 [Methylococcales bacterium]